MILLCTVVLSACGIIGSHDCAAALVGSQQTVVGSRPVGWLVLSVVGCRVVARVIVHPHRLL